MAAVADPAHVPVAEQIRVGTGMGTALHRNINTGFDFDFFVGLDEVQMVKGARRVGREEVLSSFVIFQLLSMLPHSRVYIDELGLCVCIRRNVMCWHTVTANGWLERSPASTRAKNY